MLIGLNGKIGSGKTTFAEYLVQHHGATRVSFAAALKEEVAEFLSSNEVEFQHKHLYGSPKDREFILHIPLEAVTGPMIQCQILDFGHADYGNQIFRITARSLLQWWGTEYKRSINPDYWVARVMDTLADMDATLIVIDDVRFENEADMIKTCDGFLVYIKKEEEAHSRYATHASENALANYPSFDLRVTNDFTRNFWTTIEDSLEYLTAKHSLSFTS